MSKSYTDAALRVSVFTNTTRSVLLFLAYVANDKGQCQINLRDIMTAVNCRRQKTISEILTVLQADGAIAKAPGRYSLNITLSWHWLSTHAYTPELLAQFDYKSRTKNFEDDDLDVELPEEVQEQPAAPEPTPKPAPGPMMDDIVALIQKRNELLDFKAVFPDAIELGRTRKW
jgi:hypothetical protein